MTQIQKIVLSPSRDIPFIKLVLSQSNVRRIKAGVSIEELAADIARRGLLQGLSVRAIRDTDGTETGKFEIPAGGRRFRALELLVKQKRMAKTAPVPCIVREEGLAEEDSLAENIQRAPLHPLDQFRAFLALREKGQSEEDIAATFFVAVSVVKQRLKLAAISPKLLEIYAEDGMTLEQLMAFTVNGDHERQEQVFDRLDKSHSKEPYIIRRMLTESAVKVTEKRAKFVGLDAYTAAGGAILRDLFEGDQGGWLQDSSLLDRLVAEKLCERVEVIRAEGWKWIEVAPDFAYGHTYGLRQLRGEQTVLTSEEEATRDALQAAIAEIEESYSETGEDLPEEADRRIGEIETALQVLDNRPIVFDPQEVTRAGVFVSIAGTGDLRVERGFVRPEDELAAEPEPDVEAIDGETEAVPAGADHHKNRIDTVADEAVEPEEDDGLKPIPDRLMTELTVHRTLALRFALGQNTDIAFIAALHAFCLRIFYRYAQETCLELDLKSAGFSAQAPGLADSALAVAFDARHRAWAEALPREPAELWDALVAFDSDSRQALFAHCVSLSVNAIHEAYNRRPRAMAHADHIAEVIDLDMVSAGWTPTVVNYLGRVTKARILGAVRETKGDQAADRIAHLKKGEMAEAAQVLLAGSGWLPEPLRTRGRPVTAAIGYDNATREGMGSTGEQTSSLEISGSSGERPVEIDLHKIAAE